MNRREGSWLVARLSCRWSSPLRFIVLLVSIVLIGTPSTTLSMVLTAYSGQERSDEDLAILDLGDADWVRIDHGERVSKENHERIDLPPGPHHIEWCKKFSVSFMVDPGMSASYVGRDDVVLEANYTYLLGADRSHGQGYAAFMWIEDAGTNEIIVGFKKPKRLLPGQTNSREYDRPFRLEQLYGSAGNGKYSKDMDVQRFFEAALAANRAGVKELLDAGVDLNATDRDGATALIRAAIESRADAVRLLIDLGADVNARVGGSTGYTALMFAAEYGYLDVARQLLQSPAIDVNAVTEGLTALVIADYAEHPEVRELLLEHPEIDESVGALFVKKDQMVKALAEAIEASDIPRGLQNSLTWTLRPAYASNEPEAYCTALERFIKKVGAKKGKKISVEDAESWISDAEQIIDLSCTGAAETNPSD